MTILCTACKKNPAEFVVAAQSVITINRVCIQCLKKLVDEYANRTWQIESVEHYFDRIMVVPPGT